MNIAMYTSPLTTGHAARGTGLYTKELLLALEQIGPDIQVRPFQNNAEITSDIDIVHVPFFDPYFLTLPIGLNKPMVVTIHDLIPMVYRSHFPAGLRGLVKWNLQKRRIRAAQAIITDSESSKKDIVQFLGFSEAIVFPIYLAARSGFQPASEAVIQAVRDRYQLPSEFLLYVGDVNWNKNIPKLLEAVREIDLPLVLVGKAFLQNNLAEVKAINQLISDHNIESRIIKVGFVEDVDLPAVYSAARLTIQVSIAEGFGLPVLESMACGTPCVVSNTTSLKEIAGPSLLVDPDSVSAIATGIRQALMIKKEDQSKDCLAWAQRFSWQQTAAETVAVYQHVLSS